MELKEFVKETLLQIIQGVKEAQEEAPKFGAAVNPGEIVGSNLQLASVNGEGCTVQNIEFEVGLTTSNAETAKSGIGVMLGGIGAGTNKSANEQQSSATKIKFTVPLVLPYSITGSRDYGDGLL